MVLREGKGWREESVEASSGGGRPILIGNFAWRVRMVVMETVKRWGVAGPGVIISTLCSNLILGLLGELDRVSMFLALGMWLGTPGSIGMCPRHARVRGG